MHTIKSLLMIFLLTLVGCQNEEAQPTSSTQEPNRNPAGITARNLERTEVDVAISVDDQHGLNLLNTDSYQAIIDGCLSGFNQTMDESTASTQVQATDVNCKFRILTMTYLGEIFTPSPTQSWAQGQSFNVIGQFGSRMNFRVSDQLNNPISGPQTVHIKFGIAEEGQTQSAGASVHTGVSVSGIDPVSIDLIGIDVTVDATDGAGLFNLSFECNEPLVGTGSSATCQGQATEDYVFGIGIDQHGGQDLSLDECLAYTQGGDTGITFDQGSDPTFPNGGLDVSDLKGPSALYDPANAELILAVSGPDGGCRYFPISVQAP